MAGNAAAAGAVARELFKMDATGDWLTAMLAKLWPFVTKAVEKQVQDMVPGILENSKPKWMESITLDKFHLGPEPPQIREISVDKEDDDELPEVRLVIRLSWNSKTDIELTVKPLPENIKLMPGFLENTLQYLATTHAGVENLSVDATAIITFCPLGNVLPVVRALQVSLREPPKLDFRITVFQGQSGILNLLKPWLLNLISGIVSGILVTPEHICVKLDPTAPDYFKPEGLLRVQIEEASDVPSADWFSKSDAFVEAWVRSKKKQRTAVVKGDKPQWHETKHFLVHTRQYQKLTLQLLDQDSRSDDSIGYAKLDLSTLQPGVPLDTWLPVFKDDAEGSKPLGKTKLHVVATFLSSSVDAVSAGLKALSLQPGALVPSEGAAPEVLAVGNSGALKVTLMSVTMRDPSVAPLMARIKVAGQVEDTGLVKPLTPDSNELLFNQTRDFELYHNNITDQEAITIELLKTKTGLPVAVVSTPLSAVKAMRTEPCAAGGILELHTELKDYTVKLEAWYFHV